MADFRHFLSAQQGIYERACSELQAGRKTSHWMWFIFPQIAGLGRSDMARRYALASVDEARDYAAHDVLGARLRHCTALACQVEGSSVKAIFGDPDDLKFRSCMTLFDLAQPHGIFADALARYFAGAGDAATLRLIAQQTPGAFTRG